MIPEQRHQLGVDRNQSAVTGGAVLERASLAGPAAVGPLRAAARL
jgi:hypothetical protein